MDSNELQLKASSFTTVTALAKEIGVLLEDADRSLVVLAPRESWDSIVDELQGRIETGRVTIVRLNEEGCHVYGDAD